MVKSKLKADSSRDRIGGSTMEILKKQSLKYRLS